MLSYPRSGLQLTLLRRDHSPTDTIANYKGLHMTNKSKALMKNMKELLDDILNEQLESSNGDQEYITKIEQLLHRYDNLLDEGEL